MIEIFLKTKDREEVINPGESKNYEKDSLLVFSCPNCNNKNSIPLIGTSSKVVILKFPNKQDYSLVEIREISNRFNLKEDYYPKTGIHSFKTKTLEGYKQCFLEMIECVSCNTHYNFCLSYYGDYSRYPGAMIHLVGVKK